MSFDRERYRADIRLAQKLAQARGQEVIGMQWRGDHYAGITQPKTKRSKTESLEDSESRKIHRGV